MNPKTKFRRTATLAALLLAHTALAVACGSAAHAAPSTERVSVNSAELQADGGSVTPAVSNDGSNIAFTSGATNFHGGLHNSNDVYLRDKVRGYGMRMVGPNCMGLLNANAAVSLNASFSPIFPLTGRCRPLFAEWRARAGDPRPRLRSRRRPVDLRQRRQQSGCL